MAASCPRSPRAITWSWSTRSWSRRSTRRAPASARSRRSRSPAASGLIGALLVGVSTAKALAAARRLPLIPVDHFRGHVAANFLEPDPLEPPFLCLIASGHTLLAGVRDHRGYELLGSTLDDAAGEAFDKGARLLGLASPGGPAIQRAAERGDPGAFEFPVAMTRGPGLDFSFSGLKTALVYQVRDLGREAPPRAVPTSRPPTSGRSSTSSSPSSSAPCARRSGRRSRSAAASPRTPSCARAPSGSAGGATCV